MKDYQVTNKETFQSIPCTATILSILGASRIADLRESCKRRTKKSSKKEN